MKKPKNYKSAYKHILLSATEHRVRSLIFFLYRIKVIKERVIKTTMSLQGIMHYAGTRT